MLILATLVGIYTYSIFLLGIFGFLYISVVIGVSTGFWIISGFVFRKKLLLTIKSLFSSLKAKDKSILFLAIIFVLQAFINLIGVLGPELGFDALWYHLELPKLYLLHHSIFHVPGGLLYYSDMPKLGEMLYVGALAFGNEIFAKTIHFSFGLLTSLALYKFSRKFYSQQVSMVAVVIFYANLVVAWESITAYIELIRAFFEITALWSFLTWYKKMERKWLLLSAVMLGLAIITKVLAIGSLVIFLLLILIKSLNKRDSGVTSFPRMTVLDFARKIKDIIIFSCIVLIIPLPWFIFAFVHTGNPVYPFFTPVYGVSPVSFSVINFLKEIWEQFMRSADPISPVYAIMFPLMIFFYRKFKAETKIIAVYSLLSIIVWYFTPRTGGGRFILPYLPAMSLLCAATFEQITVNKSLFTNFLKNFLLSVIIFVALTSVGYRFVANIKYIPVITGKESKEKFLSDHLNFSYGDFFDTDGYFKSHIKPKDMVLLIGFHNLYYVDFPFIDSSWVKRWDKFNYIATQNAELPERFKNWKLIYTNPKTLVKLYRLGDKTWTY